MFRFYVYLFTRPVWMRKGKDCEKCFTINILEADTEEQARRLTIGMVQEHGRLVNDFMKLGICTRVGLGIAFD